ncbi:hypothetical protein PENTCL1PPCAC_15493, partial [Pristionchus entomophagus]
IQLLLQWMRNIVSDLKKKILLHHNVHFDHCLGADVVDHHVINLSESLIVVDGYLQHPRQLLLLRAHARQRGNVLE